MYLDFIVNVVNFYFVIFVFIIIILHIFRVRARVCV